MDPYEHPGNFFDEEVVLTSEPLSPLFDCEAIFEKILWIRILAPGGPKVFVPICGITGALKHCTSGFGNNGHLFDS